MVAKRARRNENAGRRARGGGRALRLAVAAVAAAVAAMAVAAPLSAQEMQARFAVRALGLKVGDLVLNGTVTDNRYAVASQFTTSGLVGAVAGVKFLLSAAGRVENGQFRPDRYDEEMDTGRRESRVSLRYARGVARAQGSQVGARPPWAVSDAQQRGAVDPLTAMFMVIRDQPRDGLCRVNQRIYDGERLTQIVLEERRDRGAEVTCSGTFRRIGGYPAEELSRKPVFGLSVAYVPGPGGVMQASHMRADTTHGPASLVRR